MSTGGRQAGGCGVDKGIASHLQGADSPMVHQSLALAVKRQFCFRDSNVQKSTEMCVNHLSDDGFD